MLECRHKDHLTSWKAAESLAAMLRMKYAQHVTGPAEPPVNRIRNLYISEILLKLPRNSEYLAEVKKYIFECIAEMLHQPDYKTVFVSIDVDPQ
jgi:primosomal protein N' (replication factor Y)